MADDRLTIREKLFDTYETDILWTLAGTIEWLKDLEEKVPEEFKDDAVFHVELERGFYDSSDTLTFEVYYDRPETDEEMAARVRNEIQERQIYEQLRRKFG